MNLPPMVNFTLEEARFEFRGHRRLGDEINTIITNNINEARGQGQEEIVENLKKWAQMARGKNIPPMSAGEIYEMLETGDWMEDLLILEANAEAPREAQPISQTP